MNRWINQTPNFRINWSLFAKSIGMQYEKIFGVPVDIPRLREMGVITTTDVTIAPPTFSSRGKETRRLNKYRSLRSASNTFPIAVACLIFSSCVDVSDGNQILGDYASDQQLSGGGNHYISRRRDQTACAPPAGGCGNGIWSEDGCQCMCVPPYCYDDLFQSCVTIGSCSNPFEGCTVGIDCPYFPDPSSGACVSGSVVSAGVYTVYWGQKECCDNNYVGSTTCFEKDETSSPTSSPTVPLTESSVVDDEQESPVVGGNESNASIVGDKENEIFVLDDNNSTTLGVRLDLIPIYFYNLPSNVDLDDDHFRSLESIVSNAAGQLIETLGVELISVNIIDELWDRRILAYSGSRFFEGEAGTIWLPKFGRRVENETDFRNNDNTTLNENNLNTTSNSFEDGESLTNQTMGDEDKSEGGVLTLWLEIFVIESIFSPDEVRSMVMRSLRENKEDMIDMLKKSWTSDLFTSDVTLKIGDIDTETLSPSRSPTSSSSSIAVTSVSPRDVVYNENGGNGNRFLPLWIVISFAFLFLAVFGGFLYWQKKQDSKLLDQPSVTGALTFESYGDSPSYRSGVTSRQSTRHQLAMIKTSPSHDVSGSHISRVSGRSKRSFGLPSLSGSDNGAFQHSNAKSSTFSYIPQPSGDYVDDAQERLEGDLMESYMRRQSQEEENEKMDDGYDAEKSSYMNSFGNSSNNSSFARGNRGIDPEEDHVSKEGGDSVLGLFYYAGASSSEDEATHDPLESAFGTRSAPNGATSSRSRSTSRSRSSRRSRKSARSKSSDAKSSSSKTTASRRRKQNSLHRVGEEDYLSHEHSVGYQQNPSFDDNPQHINAAGTYVSHLTTDSSFQQAYVHNIHTSHKSSNGGRKSSAADGYSASGLSLTVDSTGDYVI